MLGSRATVWSTAQRRQLQKARYNSNTTVAKTINFNNEEVEVALEAKVHIYYD